MPVRQPPDIAVFARNHSDYLEYAKDVGEDDSARSVPFRSRKLWSAARRALERQRSVWVFFAVVGQPDVQFRARLQEVHLNPTASDPVIERLIRLGPPR